MPLRRGHRVSQGCFIKVPTQVAPPAAAPPRPSGQHVGAVHSNPHQWRDDLTGSAWGGGAAWLRRQQQRQQQQHYRAWWHGNTAGRHSREIKCPTWLQLDGSTQPPLQHSQQPRRVPYVQEFYYAKRKSERKILSRIRGRSGLSLSSQERTQGRALPPSESSSGASSDDDMSDNGAASSDETRDGGADGVKVNDAHSDCGHRQGNGLWDFSSEIYGRLNSIKRQKNQDRENYKWLVALAKCSRIFTRGQEASSATS